MTNISFVSRNAIRCICTAVIFVSFGMKASAQFGGGDGSSTTPYRIVEAVHLKSLADSVNNGQDYSGKFFRLENDIDLSDYGKGASFNSGKGWIPIGSTSIRSFQGSFDGNGKKITHLYINDTSSPYVGLFAVLGGTVKKLGVENVDITGKNTVGGIASMVIDDGGITNCYTTGTVSGTSTIGGVAGYVNGGWSSWGGSASGYVSNCYSTASVSGTSYVGGIAGVIGEAGYVTNCYSTGEVSGTNMVGGIAGIVDEEGSVKNCAALNYSVKSTGTSVGRVVGENVSVISNNIAYSGILNQAENTTWSNKGLSHLNGEDMTFQAIHADGTLDGRFTTPWITQNGKLPGFGTAVETPIHLMLPYASGGGTETDPYIITTPQQLAALASRVNVGDTNYNNKHYQLANDIDLAIYDANNTAFNSGKGWIPIGGNYYFRGKFNGNNKKITNLYINDNTRSPCGLFGYVYQGKIENLGVENVNISGGNSVGGVAGYVYSISSLSNCYATGKVSGNNDVGGVVGRFTNVDYSSSVSNCYSTGEVSGVQFVGGVAGGVSCMGASLSNCYSTSEVSGSNDVGGVVGGDPMVGGSSVSNCAALNKSVKITGTSGTPRVGRVAGVGSAMRLSGNIAFNGLLNKSGNTTWDNKGLYQIDGTDISAQEIESNGSLHSHFLPSDSTWTVVNGYLPGLGGKVVEIPWHLRYNAPKPVIITQPQDATIATNASHTLSVTASVAAGNLSYSWYSNSAPGNSGGTMISGATASSYQPPTDLKGVFYYYVEITNYMADNGNGGNLMASATSRAITFTVQDGTGIAVRANNYSPIRVYPNPTKGELTIQWNEKTSKQANELQIFDIYGRKVHKSTCPPAHSSIVDVSHLPAGIYFLKTGDTRVKFVKN